MRYTRAAIDVAYHATPSCASAQCLLHRLDLPLGAFELARVR
jgi:hypothetical protein